MGPVPSFLASTCAFLKLVRILKHKFSFPSSSTYLSACSSVSHNVALSLLPAESFASISATVAMRPNTSAISNHGSDNMGKFS